MGFYLNMFAKTLLLNLPHFGTGFHYLIVLSFKEIAISLVIFVTEVEYLIKISF